MGELSEQDRQAAGEAFVAAHGTTDEVVQAWGPVRVAGLRECREEGVHDARVVAQVNRGPQRQRLYVYRCVRCCGIFRSDSGRRPVNDPDGHYERMREMPEGAE